MRVKASHLTVIFEEVRKVREWLVTYCSGPNKVPVSLDDITAAIEALYGTKITIQLVPIDSPLLRGMIEIYDKRATITVDAGLNTPDTRYVYVKEACHIMLLNAENATKDPGAIIEYYVHNRPDEDDGSHPEEIVCEEITKYGAVELLFPPALRLPAKAKIASNEATLFTVGESLHISENLVEFTLTDWYMDLSTRLRGDGPDRERFKPAQAAPKRS